MLVFMRGAARRISIAMLVAGVVMGCTTEIGGRDRRDAASDVGASTDARTLETDAAALDAASEPDAADEDAFVPAPDTGPLCTPTHTACHGELECGAVPNGCPGESLDCGACGGGETWCAVLDAPRWLGRVRTCVPTVIAAHPEYFDATMPCAPDSPLVLDARAAEYVADVAACVDGSGAVAIVDMNAPMNEIRVRGTDDDIADNYPVRVYSTGCTRKAYTSSCTPAFF
jgi:hypothetical protein